jgi:hypothetical protein
MLSTLSHVIFASAALCSAASLAAPPAAPTPEATPPGFAVVELFTSEGCSSCPPADALLAKLAAERKDTPEHVYFLAFHVDYWDYLGWKDPFASKEASQRQRWYAESPAKPEDKNSVYTPQLIVNGRDGFVGSDETHARASINAALKEPPRASVTPTLMPRKAGEPIKLSARITGTDLVSPKQDRTLRGATVLAAVVEDGLSTSVKRGENSGRTLAHERVVRAFTTVPIAEPGAPGHEFDTTTQLELKVPEGVKEDHCRVIVFVQRRGAVGVLGAGEIPLKSPAEAPAQKQPAAPTTSQTPNPAPK